MVPYGQADRADWHMYLLLLDQRGADTLLSTLFASLRFSLFFLSVTRPVVVHGRHLGGMSSLPIR